MMPVPPTAGGTLTVGVSSFASEGGTRMTLPRGVKWKAKEKSGEI